MNKANTKRIVRWCFSVFLMLTIFLPISLPFTISFAIQLIGNAISSFGERMLELTELFANVTGYRKLINKTRDKLNRWEKK